MQLTILDKIIENEAFCFLCKTTLHSYVESLPEDYKEFYVQREIVNNAFLDNLWDSIVDGNHIPIIVLVSNDIHEDVRIGSELKVNHFQILDGLQRTHRLNEIWKIIIFINEPKPYLDLFGEIEYSDSVLINNEINNFIKLNYKRIKDEGINLKLFKKIYTSYLRGVDLELKFKESTLWLELWSDMTEEHKIKKMLVLNAGQKSVNIKHQIELLFWSNLSLFEGKFGKSNILREKQTSSMFFSKHREKGQFHFAHIVSAFVSLQEAKAKNTNMQYTADAAFRSGEENSHLANIDLDILNEFADVLFDLDVVMATDEQISWLGREAVLVGIFAGIGKAAQVAKDGEGISASAYNIAVINELHKFKNNLKLFEKLIDVSGFEQQRKSVTHSQVNVGNINRAAVRDAVYQLIDTGFESKEVVNWALYFPGEQK